MGCHLVCRSISHANDVLLPSNGRGSSAQFRVGGATGRPRRRFLAVAGIPSTPISALPRPPTSSGVSTRPTPVAAPDVISANSGTTSRGLPPGPRSYLSQ